MTKKRQKNKITKAIKGIIRQEHFENGGSLKEWRGISAIHKDKRDKRKNRLNKKKNAIKEFDD